MAKDADNLANRFESENTGGLLSGFLAEEDEFDRRALWRLGSWAGGTVAAITIAELWHGVERASAAHRSSRQAYLESLITVLPIIRYTEHTAYVHARLWAGLETSGKNIGPYGPIVAATALQRGSTLATFKQTPLLRVKGLQLIEPKKSA